jgi:predicted RNA-binding protein with PUA-like domain
MPAYLLKTEPSSYAFADLVRERRCVWSGVANPQARIALRAMRVGDVAWIYHTGSQKAIVGLAKVVRGAYEDPEQPGCTDAGEPKAPVVDLAPSHGLAQPITLAELKGDVRFQDFALVTQGRLSAMVVPTTIERALRSLAGRTS